MPRGIYPRGPRKPLSDTTKAKIAALLKGKKHPPERCAASSKGHKGHIATDAHKAAISKGVKEAMQRPDVIERHLAGLKAALSKMPDGRFYKGGKGQAPRQIVFDFAAVLCPAGYLMDEIRVLKGPGMSAGHYTLDFAHPEAMVDIEIDGSSHRHAKEKDTKRDALLRSLGWKIIRIKV